MSQPPIQQWAGHYIGNLGLAVVPLAARSKKCVVDDWMNRTFAVEHFAENANIGLRSINGLVVQQRHPCRAFPIRGKRRCRLHGGLSTGPRTAAGLERSRRARWKHGRFSQAAIEARRIARWETREQGMARIEREERRTASRALGV